MIKRIQNAVRSFIFENLDIERVLIITRQSCYYYYYHMKNQSEM